MTASDGGILAPPRPPDAVDDLAVGPVGPSGTAPDDNDEPADLSAPPRASWPLLSWLGSRTPQEWVTFVVVAFSTVFVFHQLNPDNLIFQDSTPTGGDMGAHVWGPAFLRDELLPNFRLSGWTTDWYAGFPAYQFYFVVPALMIVALNVGMAPLPATLAVLSVLASVWLTYRHEGLARLRPWVVTAAVVVIVLSVGMPYGVAFKLVAVSGLVAMPAAAYLLGRFSGLPFPGPPIMALGTLFFIFDRSFNIYGGNAASTLAGEFSFAISLTFALFYLAFLIRSLETGRGLGWAALFLGLTALCHVIPTIFAASVTFVIVALRADAHRIRRWWFISIPAVVIGALLVLPLLFGRDLTVQLPIVIVAVLVVHVPLRRVAVAAVVASTGALLSAFWLGPFLLRHDYLNNMGWEKTDESANYLWSRQNLNPTFLRDYPPLELVVCLAVAAFVVSLAMRRRIGIVLGLVAAGFALAFDRLPEGRLWNTRVLPFYYLALYLLAAILVAEVCRLVAWAVRDSGPVWDRGAARRWSLNLSPLLVLMVVWVMVGLPMGAVPGSSTVAGTSDHTWMGLRVDNNFVPGWARWNFSGIENKSSPDAYPEFYDLVQTMDSVGAQYGCGQSLWEFAPELSRYGSTMVPMLLPHFTDGCIGSMEGLFFEASATVPYHFLMQSELSGPAVDPEGDGSFVGGPSRPMRNLPYGPFDIDLGVDHLQMLGVRYYLAFSDTAVAAAAVHPDLTEVAVSGPWHVYEVAGAALVAPLDNEPAVLTGVSDHQAEWIDVAIPWFLDRNDWSVMLTQGGPSSWQRVGVESEGVDDVYDSSVVAPEARPLDPVVVSGITYDQDEISFTVDQVGVPVLVRMSYFPNWQVEGADGPWRVAPNLMVVIPTDTEVRLSYGRTGVDLLSATLTLLGIVGLVLLFRGGRVALDDRSPDLVGALDHAALAVRRSWTEARPVVTDEPADSWAPDDTASTVGWAPDDTASTVGWAPDDTASTVGSDGWAPDDMASTVGSDELPWPPPSLWGTGGSDPPAGSTLDASGPDLTPPG